MSRKRRDGVRAAKGPGAAKDGRNARGGRGGKKGAVDRAALGDESWLSAKRPILLFLLVFVVLMTTFYLFFYIPFSDGQIFRSYLAGMADVCAFVLRIVGQDVTSSGQSLVSPKFSVSIQKECDGLEVLGMLLAAIVAFPVSVRAKLWAIPLGCLLVGVTNVVRICTLFCVGVYFPTAFRTMHIGVWQVLFILVVLSCWLVWAVWATRSRSFQVDVAG